MNRSWVVSTQDELMRAAKYASQCPVDQRLELTLKDYQDNRRSAQNALYWVWMTEIGKETGYTKEEMHEIFKNQFLKDMFHQIKGLDGNVIDVHPTTKTLKVKRFAEYLTSIEHFTNTVIGFTLSHPEDKYYRAMGLIK